MSLNLLVYALIFGVVFALLFPIFQKSFKPKFVSVLIFSALVYLLYFWLFVSNVHFSF
ncbi:hypothetical protein [Endomicrobium proavitum]|uniref:Uncharacterized protein n=1 Tax=Endomicrobium proavitum TaxID=1408281 RepID=A0A0G3WHW6_9BACT|nr:hypothetical protein [Endomicrobium proavitum]AKL98276.1 hypothetical protein Epro_0897 [Endomicrobium proavitum]